MIKAVTTSIKATSRVAIKVRDNFYTVEFSEERAVPDSADINLEQERAELWDAVNGSVDEQCEQILKTFKQPVVILSII